MAVALIPVLDISYPNPAVAVPASYPYWQNAPRWDAYYAACQAKAGFPDALPPYLPGASFYQLATVTDRNLAKLTKDHTADLRAGTYAREEAVGFFGGYVLQLDGEAVFFPQCCGQLRDIGYWAQLAAGSAAPYEGHPAPTLRFTADTVRLDFTAGPRDEAFQPPPPRLSVEISRAALQLAVQQANRELDRFAQRLRALNEAEKLGVPALEQLLIWEDGRPA